MLGPYVTSVVPYYCTVASLSLFLYPCSPDSVIIVPHQTPLFLLLALRLLFLGQLGLYCDPMDSSI